MKRYDEFINESDDSNPFDSMIEGLKKSKIANGINGRSYTDNNDVEIYQITFELYVNGDFTSIEGFKNKLDKIEQFVNENFNPNYSTISNALRNGNIGLIYSMTKEELETSKGYIPYMTIDKYDL